MGPVHLAPPAVAIGGQPQVGFLEVAEEEELAHLPGGGEAQHVLDPLAGNLADDGETLVLPPDRGGLVLAATPRRPAHKVAVGPVGGGERLVHAHPSHGTVGVVIALDEAREFVMSQCPALAAGGVACRAAVGLVLAAPVVAAEDVPPFANSAVDGYAVVASSIAAAGAGSPVEMPVVGEVAAGAHTDRVLQPGRRSAS